MCPRCKSLVGNDLLREMVEPGKSRGVWWCLICCLDYLEVTDV